MVELVPFQEEEDIALFTKWAAAEIGAYQLGSVQFLTPEQVKRALGMAGPRAGILLIRTLDGRSIGSVEWTQQRYYGYYSLGVMVGERAQWGRGYGTDAASLVLELLFHEFNAHRVEVISGAYNTQMVELLTQHRLMHVEGVLRDYYFLDGEYHDAVVGSILRHEYYDPTGPLRSYVYDAIPSSEKLAARRMIREYLSANPSPGSVSVGPAPVSPNGPPGDGE